MYATITVEVDRACGDGAYRSHRINFAGHLVKIIEDGHTTMRLYEWADHRGYLVFLVHLEDDKSGRTPKRTLLYPFINTHLAGVIPKKGYTAEEVSRAYPEFANETFLEPSRRMQTR